MRMNLKRSNFALRLQPALLDEARKLAASEGVALNQPINVAVAEKVSALRTGEHFAERAERADPTKMERILRRVDKGTRLWKGTSYQLAGTPGVNPRQLFCERSSRLEDLSV